MSAKAAYLDTSLPVELRAKDLVSRMTLEEKVSQMVHDAPPVERLGIPAYDWWNECLHGVGRAGIATVFPQAIGLAATWNADLMHRVATVISDEARAKHHRALREGQSNWYTGLTFWSPNINIFRDPRWGRGQETYGEDPYLTARLGVAFVKGLQGDDPRYLKLVATAKHYAVHSGPEADRHHFDARASARDLRETYLPAFQACVTEGKAMSVMGAYNRTNGEVCCGSRTLLADILRGEWGFDGYVVSDCGAVGDFHLHHKVTANAAESAALAVRNGCELNCGDTFPALVQAVREGLITEAEIDTAVSRLFTVRFKLGMFDPGERVPYAAIPPSVVRCKRHVWLAREMARESIVLLKNAGNLLPLRKDLKAVAVIGPNAYAPRPLHGNYHGYSPQMVTPFEGIVGAVSAGTDVTYDEGCPLAADRPVNEGRLAWMVNHVDVIIAVLGLAPALEGEEGDTDDPAAAAGGGDRLHINLPGRQEELLRKLHATGKPVVLVLTGGSPIAIPWAKENIPAILMTWYGGEQAGAALADVLFGDYNPAGRLPVTFPRSLDQLPPFRDYAMQNRTYRFLNEEPLFRFGFGLSYTTFAYSNLRLSKATIGGKESVRVTCEVTNAGERAGDEVAQLYVSDLAASVPVPLRHLEGMRRIHLKPRQTKRLRFTLRAAQLAAYSEEGRPFVEPGEFRIAVGGGQPEDPASGAQSAVLTVVER